MNFDTESKFKKFLYIFFFLAGGKWEEGDLGKGGQRAAGMVCGGGRV